MFSIGAAIYLYLLISQNVLLLMQFLLRCTHLSTSQVSFLDNSMVKLETIRIVLNDSEENFN